MTAPTEKTLNVGLRYASIFELDANNYPKASGATAYEGLQFKGSTAFTLNFPDARKLTGLGEDGITQVVYLPPQEGADGSLNVEGADPTIIALLDGVKLVTVGEMTAVGAGTNRQGFEPSVALLLYQMAVGLDTGKQYWHSYVMPSARVIQKPNAMQAEKNPTVYQVAPNRVSKHIWGEAFSMATEGFLSGQMVRLWSNYPPRIAAYLGDGTATEFNFPANYPAISTAGVVVWKNGTKVVSGLTVTTTKITFSVAPALNDVIVVLREYSG